ncbi:MAG: flagellar biosynthesis protein FliQ [Acidimicrobiia bacterium]|nr:flagellar biosynthesis protein FliQ [Acidimicrobiia bacterium]
MSEADVMQIITDAMWVATRIGAPILLTSIVVGVAVGLLQSVTQIQEPTLSFVPKFVAIGLVIIITGPWMLQEIVSYTEGLIRSLPGLIS